MERAVFQGVVTALVTHSRKVGSVDCHRLEGLLEFR